jgi:citrate lyase subunit beta/citryl-CoA lyase
MRSFLFAPADNIRRAQKALASDADAVILDLEDSIASNRKASAREALAEFLAEIGRDEEGPVEEAAPRPKVFVRINALASADWQQDLRALQSNLPSGIVLPKCLSGHDIHQLSVALSAIEEAAGVQTGQTSILPLVTETPQSIFNLSTYAEASHRLIALTWGAEDLSAQTGARATRREDGQWTSPYQLVRDMTLFAAAAAGLSAIDTVFINFRDLAGLEQEARAAARDGFSGKLAIHPDQVPVINDAFLPTDRELELAQRLVDAFAVQPDAGVVSLDGEMMDRPHLERAKRIIAASQSMKK